MHTHKKAHRIAKPRFLRRSHFSHTFSTQVGLYLYLPPSGSARDNADVAPPSDVVALSAASLRAGLFLAASGDEGAAAADGAAAAHAPRPGSVFAYRVNGGPWALAARDVALPGRRYHAAISLFTDPQGTHMRSFLRPVFALTLFSALSGACSASGAGGGGVQSRPAFCVCSADSR
jgi:hypothetical protein